MKRHVSLFTKKNKDLLNTKYLERKEHKTSTCSNILFDPLLEAVLIPKQEVSEIIQLLVKNKKELSVDKNKEEKFCYQLDDILKKYKISFSYDDSLRNDVFFPRGFHEQRNNIIYFICSSRISLINENDKYFYDFLDGFKLLIGHELVHRMQFIQRSHKIILNNSNQEDIKEQLSGNQEIMAYAWQAVEELRYRFGNDKEILEHIKKYDLMFFRHSTILSAYYSLFEKDDPILKKFYKDMYLYLEG